MKHFHITSIICNYFNIIATIITTGYNFGAILQICNVRRWGLKPKTHAN